jgi:Zn ribbon nucleic-acid-binding protein
MKCDFCGKEFMGFEFRGIDKRTGNEVIIRKCIKCAYEHAAEKKEIKKHGTIDGRKRG